MNHPIEFLFAHGTRFLSDAMLAQPSARNANHDDVCGCCDRRSHDWSVQVAHTRKESGLSSVNCTACQSLYHASLDQVGLLRVQGRKSVGLSFGMMRQATLVVREGHRPLVLAPSGWVEKIRPEQGRSFDLVTAVGGAKTRAVAQMLLNSHYPALVAEFDSQKPPLVANLKLSQSPSDTYWCSVGACEAINLSKVMGLVDQMSALSLDAATQKKWRAYVYGLTSGTTKPDDDKLHAFFDKHSALIDITQQLPTDPYARRSVLTFMRLLNDE